MRRLRATRSQSRASEQGRVVDSEIRGRDVSLPEATMQTQRTSGVISPAFGMTWESSRLNGRIICGRRPARTSIPTTWSELSTIQRLAPSCADRSIPKLGRLIAYLIAGHHPGLANGEDGDAPQSSLKERLRKAVAEYRETLPREVSAYRPAVPLPQFSMRSGQSLAFFLRFLFSCLTDADFLATESFMNPMQSSSRPQNQPSIAEMETALTRHLDELSCGGRENEGQSTRAEILEGLPDRRRTTAGIILAHCSDWRRKDSFLACLRAQTCAAA